jgi:putative membrane protein (TIGR04086 family)
MKKHKSQRRERSGAKAILFGTLMSLGLLFAVSAAASFVLLKLEDPISFLGAGSLASLLISGAISAFITAKYKGEGGFLSSLFSSLIFSLVIFSAALIIGKGKLGIGLLMNILCYLLISVLSAKLATRKAKRRR